MNKCSVLTQLRLMSRAFIVKGTKAETKRVIMSVQTSGVCDWTAVVYFSTDCI